MPHQALAFDKSALLTPCRPVQQGKQHGQLPITKPDPVSAPAISSRKGSALKCVGRPNCWPSTGSGWPNGRAMPRSQD